MKIEFKYYNIINMPRQESRLENVLITIFYLIISIIVIFYNIVIIAENDVKENITEENQEEFMDKNGCDYYSIVLQVFTYICDGVIGALLMMFIAHKLIENNIVSGFPRFLCECTYIFKPIIIFIITAGFYLVFPIFMYIMYFPDMGDDFEKLCKDDYPLTYYGITILALGVFPTYNLGLPLYLCINEYCENRDRYRRNNRQQYNTML